MAIIGGGIGGLSAALHLLRAGFDVHVYEQAPRITEIGAGIQISPNASRLLIRLGLKPALDAAGVLPQAVHQRRWDDGRTLQRAPVGREVEDDLRRAVLPLPSRRSRQPAGRGAAGRACACRPQAGRPRAEGRARRRALRERRDASRPTCWSAPTASTARVRHLVFGPEKPRFTGCVAWRGLVPAERIAHLGIEVASHNWMGPDGHVVHYWVSAGRFMNVVCVVEHGDWTSESLDRQGRRRRCAGALRGLASDRARPDRRLSRDLHLGAARPPAAAALERRPRHAAGRCLPSHAAHHGAGRRAVDRGWRGAGVAADGDARTTCRARSRRYEAIRKPRATRLQEASAANRTRFHLPDGPEQQARDAGDGHLGRPLDRQHRLALPARRRAI